MRLITSFIVFVASFSAQQQLAYWCHWNVTTHMSYLWYIVSALMMLISYLVGRLEDIQDIQADRIYAEQLDQKIKEIKEGK